jgi:hypothetical protein
MGPDERLARAGSPVPQQTGLDVLRPERLGQQRIFPQIDHPDRQVIGGTPPGIEEL